MVSILTFGIAKDILQTKCLSFEFEGTTTEELKRALEQTYPALKQLPSYLIAVNSEYRSNETKINSGDEIAIIPPVSGG